MSLGDVIRRLVSTNSDEFVECVPEELRSTVSALIATNYGFYICQSEGDPTLYTMNDHDASICNSFNLRVVLKSIHHKLLENEVYTKEVLSGVLLRVACDAIERLERDNTILSVSSVVAYYYLLLQIRESCFGLKDELVAGTFNEDYVPFDSPVMDLYWDRLTYAEHTTLKMMGFEIHEPLLSGDRVRTLAEHDIKERMQTMFLSPRYKAYKTFVFDRTCSDDDENYTPVNSVEWVRRRAHRLLRFSVSNGAPSASVRSVEKAIDCYTASMRTSTTGAILSSPHAVFAPKSIEGARLVKNLFEHHLRHLMEEEAIPLLEACASSSADFEVSNSNAHRGKDTKQGDRRVRAVRSTR